MSVEKRVYRYACAPTATQEEMLLCWDELCRRLWNHFVGQHHYHRRKWRMGFGGERHRERRPDWKKQSKEVTDIRNAKKNPECAEIFEPMPQQLAAEVVERVKKAMQGVYEGRAKMPRFKRRDEPYNLCFKEGRHAKKKSLSGEWGAVFVSKKLGWIRFRWEKHRLPEGCKLTRIKFKQTPKGWEVQIGWEGEVSRTHAHPDRMVGLDRGVKVAVMCADEEGGRREFHLPESISGKNAPLNERLKMLQRRLPRGPRAKKSARRKQVEMKGPDKKTGYLGSRRYRKARAQVEKTHHRIANIRREWQHETAAEICREYGVVAMEKLRTKDMTGSAKGTREKPGRRVKAKSGLNRAILAVGWGGLEHKIEYRAGKEAVVEVSAAYTSQTCSQCGHVAAESRRTQAEFVCVKCRFEANADENAARNILWAGKEKRAGRGGGGKAAGKGK